VGLESKFGYVARFFYVLLLFVLSRNDVGDLFVTCLSPLSRNYRVGYALGQGKNLDQVVEELGQVAEGVNTLSLVKHKADELDIYMPLVKGLYGVIYGGQAISEVIESMMSGEQNQDVEFIWAGQ
jgi:glycerol-3-phosphate dehydrogenase (NAD(P)+)